MRKPFSRRNKPASANLSEEIPGTTRRRLMFSFAQFSHQRQYDFRGIVVDCARRALNEYGELNSPQLRVPEQEALNHFATCPTDRFLDLLEWSFEHGEYRGGQEGVDLINRIFREDGIGYMFTQYVLVTERIPSIYGGGAQGYRSTVTNIPEAIKISDQQVHADTITPAIDLLTGKIWKVANDEMLKAHEHLRLGNFVDAIHWACKSLESVLQIICSTKGWTFKPDKDTLMPLLQTCASHGLFPSPYVEAVQQTSGLIRNRYGGHGKAITNTGNATEDMAAHLLQITSAHIVFIGKRAGL